MKLIIACEIYPPDVGGPATFVKALVPVLTKAGHSVKVLTYADKKSIEESLVKVSRKGPIFLRYWRYFWALKKLTKSADLIFAQGPIAAGLPAILVKKLTGKKVFIKIVGDVAWERARNRGKVKELIDDFQTKKYSGSIERNKKLRSWTTKKADLVIAPSQYLKLIVVGWGVSENKVKVVYNSFKPGRTNVIKENAKQRLNLSGEVILSVGRLTPWKGFDLLIDLMPVLLMVNNQFKLVIVGSGPEEKKLKFKIQELKLEDKVILAGSVFMEKMSNYYQAADIFILNSSYEGLSHTLLEALSFGLPVVASNVGGNPEVIEHNQNGLLAEYNNQQQILDSIKKLSSNSGLVERFKQANKEVIKNFSKDKMYKKYLELLK